MVTNDIVLGHIVSSTGIEVDKSKIELIANLPTPKSVKDVRSILGHAGFYRRFIKDFSVISKPLSNLLTKDNIFEWTFPCHVIINSCHCHYIIGNFIQKYYIIVNFITHSCCTI